MKKKIYLYVIAMAIAGLMISSAAGLPMAQVKNNTVTKNNNIEEETKDYSPDDFKDEREDFFTAIKENPELLSSGKFKKAEGIYQKDLPSDAELQVRPAEAPVVKDFKMEKAAGVSLVSADKLMSKRGSREVDEVYALHPVFEEGAEPGLHWGNENMVMIYEVEMFGTVPEEDDFGPTLLFQFSNNSMENDSLMYYVYDDDPTVAIDYKYPSIDYWGKNGSNDVWYATFQSPPGPPYMTPSGENEGYPVKSDNINLLRIEAYPEFWPDDPGNCTELFVLNYSNCDGAQYSGGGYNYHYPVISCDDRNEPWDWGKIALIQSDLWYKNLTGETYPGEFTVIDAAAYFWQQNAEGDCKMLSWLGSGRTMGPPDGDMTRTLSTSVYVDKGIDGPEADFYCAFDVVNLTSQQHMNWFARLNIADYTDPYSGASVWSYITEQYSMRFPSVASNNQMTPLFLEFHDLLDDTYVDLIAYYMTYNDYYDDVWPNNAIGMELAAAWGGDNIKIRYPDVSYVDGSTFAVTCIAEGLPETTTPTLLFGVSHDGGRNWDSLWYYSDYENAEYVISEYRSNSISGRGSLFMFEREMPPDTGLDGIQVVYGWNPFLTIHGRVVLEGGEPTPVAEVTIESNQTSLEDRVYMKADIVDLGGGFSGFSKRLLNGLDMWGDYDLRIIARDGGTQVGILETNWEIIDNNLTHPWETPDIELDIYYIDLVDFPMYRAYNISTRTANDMCGPACIQMIIDYIRWNRIDDPHMAPLWCEPQYDAQYNQSNLWDLYSGGDGTMDQDDILDAILALKAIDPPSQYQFAITTDSNFDDALIAIANWIDYAPDHDPGYVDHVPCPIPFYGDFNNWVTVRGIHTNHSVYGNPTPVGVHGLWVNDPLPGGIGENTYKMATELEYTYFRPIGGELLYYVLADPPEGEDPEVSLIQTAKYWDSQLPDPQGGSFVTQIFDRLIIHAATRGAEDRLSPFDSQFKEIFDQSYPGTPMLVKNLVDGEDEKTDYYIVTYNTEPKGFVKKGAHSQSDETQTVAAVIVNAETGQFKEASWVKDPVKYGMSEQEALNIVQDMLIEMGYENVPARAIHIDRVYRGDYSQFTPELRAIVTGLGLEFYI